MARRGKDNSNSIIESQLINKIEAIGTNFRANVISFVGPLFGGVDELFRSAIERMLEDGQNQKRARIVVLLETDGGSIEVVERVVGILRHHYPRAVEFVIPDHAMSAGTVLVMSGDVIHMDYYSVLGPIDPQIQKPDRSGYVPALGYLEKYKEFLDKSNKGKLTSAELAYFVKRFDQAELYRFEQARELSVSLLKEWLVRYKFRLWKKTETRKKTVTKKMKEDRAEFIARRLQDVSRWHTHGRGIHMQILKNTLKLKIEDFGADKRQNEQIRSYHRLLRDYMARLGHKLSMTTSVQYIGG